MNRAIVLTIIASVVAGSAVSTFYQGNSDQRSSQDVVLVTVDTLRSDYINCENSSESTPNICKLKSDSASFSNSYSHASYTVPAMSAVMTGRYPWKLDMLDIRSSELPEDAETLAEVLESKGYKNYASWEIGAVSPEYGFDRGFEEYRQTDLYGEGLYKKRPEGDEHLSLLDKANTDEEPSFVYYHLFGPHQPFRANEDCRNFSRNMEDTPWLEIYDVKQEYRDDFSDGKARECYKKTVELADNRTGNIIKRLKENGQYDDALVIFTSDHGEGLWDNEIFGHSRTVYEEQISVPLYVKLPESDSAARRTGSIDGGYARHVDIYPTVLDYLDIDYSSSDRPGRSLLPAIKTGKGLKSEPVKATSVKARGVIVDDYKMIETFNGWTGCDYSRCKYFKNVKENKTSVQRKEVPESYLENLKSNISGIESREMKDVSDEGQHGEDLKKRLENLGYASPSDGADSAPEEQETVLAEFFRSREKISDISDVENAVNFTDTGFEPSEIRVTQGERVVWLDQSQERKMWVASDPHPIHTGYDGSSLVQHCESNNSDAFDQCGSGNVYSFTFNREGEWGYHNHMSPEDTGTVIVEDS